MAEVIYFRYTHTANVTGTSPGHYYESDVRYGTGRYVRESDYAALMHDKLAIEGRVNQLVDNYNTLLERHRRLEEALKMYVGKFGDCGDVYDQAKAALAEEE